MRNDAEPQWQSLLPAVLFSALCQDVDVIRIFEPTVPLAAQLAEARPVVLFGGGRQKSVE